MPEHATPPIAPFAVMMASHQRQHDHEPRDAPADRNGPTTAKRKNEARVVQLWQDLPKLYARHEEERALKGAFQRLTRATTTSGKSDCHHHHHHRTSSAAEFVLITGPSGSGKTELVTRTLESLVEEAGGFFLPGKFDQIETITGENNSNNSYYYAPIISALTHFVSLIMLRHDAVVREDMRHIVTTSVRTDKVILDLVPALRELLVDRTSDGGGSAAAAAASLLLDCVETKGPGIQDRIVAAFRRLLKSLCSAERPIVLFIDDLQWAEPASLNLLWALIQDTSIEGLMIVGACRGNEVSFGHQLSVSLRELESNGTHITEIPIPNLTEAQIAEMIADVLTLAKTEQQQLLPLMNDEQDVQCLARIAKARTDGNAFFLIQFLCVLAEENLLSFADRLPLTSYDQQQQQIEEMIDRRINAKNPVALLTQKIQRMSLDTQHVLRTAACLGSEFDADLLQIVLEGANVSQALSVATEKGLIFFHTCSCNWRFYHDQIQESAYELIPADDREQFHLDLGTKLWNLLDQDMMDAYTPLVVNQLRRGAALIPTQEEKDRLAAFLLHAGTQAVASSGFLTASAHLRLGISLLDKRCHWRDQYHLSLHLFYSAAEVEYCNGNFENMDILIEEILQHVRDREDKAKVLTLRVNALGVKGDLEAAIDLGVEALAGLGESFPKKPGVFSILFAYGEVKRILKNLTDEDLLRLPKMSDPSKSASMRLMAILFPYALNGRQKLAPLIAFRMVQRTVTDGMSAVSCVGFSCFGMLLAIGFKQVDLAMRYGSVSLKMLDLCAAKEWMPRVYSAVYGFIYPWKKSLWEQLKPLLASYRVGLASGDMEFAIMSACFYSSLSLQLSCDLERTLTDAEGFLAVLQDHKQTNMINFLSPTVFFAASISTVDKSESCPRGEPFFSVDGLLQNAIEENNATTAAALMEAKLRLLSFMQDYEEAEIVALQLRQHEGVNTFPAYSKVDLHLHMGLVFAILSKRSPRHRRRRRRQAFESLRTLQSMADYCVDSIQSKILILKAEVLTLHSNTTDALEHYEKAMDLSLASQGWSELGLASELAAALCTSLGQTQQATIYMNRAYEAYADWGARAKMEQIQKSRDTMKQLHLLNKNDRLTSHDTITTQVASDVFIVEQVM